MSERAKAGSCSFTELLNHCFRNVKDGVFHFRLRIAAERNTEEHSCFLSAEHFKRFREGCALTHRNDNGFIAQLFLLSADETLWGRVAGLLVDGAFRYGEVSRFDLSDEAYSFFCMAYDLENGTSHTDIGDLSERFKLGFTGAFGTVERVFFENLRVCFSHENGFSFRVVFLALFC